jgi:hypothetical protein
METQMKLPEINWENVRSIIARAEELHQNGKMDRTAWLCLVEEFTVTSRGRLEMPGILSRSGQSEWFRALRDSSSERVA